MIRLPLVLMLASLAAACASAPRPIGQSAPPPVATQPPPTRPTVPIVQTPSDVQIMRIPGIEGVIGAGSDDLITQFGTPRLDVAEGDVRKLQFGGEPCVLDIYLYPLASGGNQVATYVDARRRSDGLDVDRAACIRSLRGY